MAARPDTTRRRREILRAARIYIGRAYPKPDLDLDDVAREIGVSRRQLQRIFREQGGEDFRGYLLRVRMEHAAKLLSRPTNPLSIRVVAGRVGYRGPSGLRQAFHRHHGVNPSEVQPPLRGYLGTLEEPESS